MFNSLSRPVALMFLLVLALPVTVLAQTTDKADVNGILLDAAGKPASGYPMKISTPQGDVIIKPTEADGAFGVDGLPPGNYTLRVFEPGGNTDKPIASKQVTLAAGQKEQIQIRLGTDNPAGAAPSESAAGRGTAGALKDNWLAIVIAAMLIAGAFGVFFVVRSQRRPGQ